jgi:hypothetical protein
MKKFAVLVAIFCLSITSGLSAQQPATLSLEIASTDVQTGQYYDVNLRVDGITELWVADFQIHYDPALLYVVGTKAGSPIQQGALFTPGLSVVMRNFVESDTLIYTISQLAPADPISGGGVVGTFRIYPLAPGMTQVLFSRVEVTHITFVETDQGRVGTDPQPIPFTPVLLELNITGSPVPAPSEATATPTPSPTPVPVIPEGVATEEPTLVNVTTAPRTPEPPATLVVPAESSSSSSLAIAVLITTAAGVGLVVILIVYWRSRR